MKLYRTSPHGDEKVIEIVSAGQTFAEAIMFMDRKTYPVSAEALMDTEVIGFDSKVFTELLRESVDTCFRVMGEMSVWLRRHLHEPVPAGVVHDGLGGSGGIADVGVGGVQDGGSQIEFADYAS